MFNKEKLNRFFENNVCCFMVTRERFKNFFGKIDEKFVTKNDLDKIVQNGLFFTIQQSQRKKIKNKQKIN